MALMDGILYRSSPRLETRSHAPGSDWYRPVSPAPTSTPLQGWTHHPLTAALAVPTIFRCVSMLSTKVGKFTPMDTRNGEPIAPQPSILTHPDPLGTPWDFYSRTAMDMLVGPAAFWLQTRGARGRVLQAELLRPSDVSVQWADLRRTRRTYTVSNVGTFPEAGTTMNARQDVVHIPYMNMTGSLIGLHPLGVARLVVDGQLAADALAASNFRDGAFPTGKITTKSALGKEAAQELKDRFVAATRGTREPVVLTGDQDFQPLAVVAKDAQWIEHRRWTAGDLARLFGVRAGALDLPVEGGANLTYTNVREIRTDVLIEGLDPLLCAIGAAIERHWLPLGHRVEWDTSSYLPPVEAVEHTPGVGADESTPETATPTPSAPLEATP